MATVPSKSRLLHQVKVRRGDTILCELPTRSMIQQIQSGTLKPTDEFSGDGVHWTPLGKHHQLSAYFDDSRSKTPMDRQLGELAQMLNDINQS